LAPEYLASNVEDKFLIEFSVCNEIEKEKDLCTWKSQYST